MSSDTVRYLSRNDLLAIIEIALPGSVELRAAGQLQAAVLRPQTSAFGEDDYPGPWRKAAALMQSVLIGHPLSDGNKRLAWLSAKAFLRLNGAKVSAAPTNAAHGLVIDVATGEIMEVPVIAELLKKLLHESE